jgi:hypothetical protein
MTSDSLNYKEPFLCCGVSAQRYSMKKIYEKQCLLDVSAGAPSIDVDIDIALLTIYIYGTKYRFVSR